MLKYDLKTSTSGIGSTLTVPRFISTVDTFSRKLLHINLKTLSAEDISPASNIISAVIDYTIKLHTCVCVYPQIHKCIYLWVRACLYVPANVRGF